MANKKALDKLNKKIAEWRFSGAEIRVNETAIGIGHSVAQHPDYPNMISHFTQSVNTCIKWLLVEECAITFNRCKGKVTCLLSVPIYSFKPFIGEAKAGEEALAFCLAWEKLIDGGIQTSG